MLIPINDNYRLASDQHNIIIQTSHVGKKGPNKGKVMWRDSTFHQTIGLALAHLLRQGVRFADITDLIELSGKIERFKNEIIEAIDKAGLEKK